MVESPVINLRHVARGLGLPLPQVQAVVELLDEGNTVPFITRYRKDQTGGLDEEQIRDIQNRLAKIRLLAERKQTILRSIQSQGKLTDELAKQIQAAGTTKRLEDLYLPYRPKKQTLATLARSRGLEQLAREILEADQMANDLDARTADFVNTDRGVPTAAEALLGAGHILAEQFSEQAELRQKLREILQRTGKLTSQEIVAETKAAEQKPKESEPAKAKEIQKVEKSSDDQTPDGHAENSSVDLSNKEEASSESTLTEQLPTENITTEVAPVKETLDNDPPTEGSQAEASQKGPHKENESVKVTRSDEASSSEISAEAAAVEEPVSEEYQTTPTATEQSSSQPRKTDEADIQHEITAKQDTGPQQIDNNAKKSEKTAEVKTNVKSGKPLPQAKKLTKAQQRKKLAHEKKVKAFRDYFNYSEELRKAPPHRILAINRGERAKIIRVKIECDMPAVIKTAEEMLVPTDHPHADFLRGCVRDSLTRLIIPGLERELRRELTDRAESHALNVFAKNLRNLLLQPPVRDRRVLAVDPGFRSGCKLVALDQFGNILDQSVIYIIGREQRLQKARTTIIDLVDRFNLSVVAIGNGTACRQTEDFFAKLINEELVQRGVAYVIVNEAGASVYSTSQLGREEFPNYDATVRGAISIGRRLQDPLSELVKIDPANIGVGMYQHDVKAKHLRESLDGVVESCVNYVGVDVNTASPALLKYVSGLNQLTARRVYEHRLQNGPFRNRQQLMEVPGFGEATFVQAAGFLKISGGDQPLDLTWIHPESYTVADRILARIDCRMEDVGSGDRAKLLAERVADVDVAAASEQLGVGELLLKDILAQLARPGRDPREDLPKPVFKQGVLKLEDLTEGMELTGTILNVVDFGTFVDIGMHDSGLVHVSQLADRFIRDPHEVVAVGDIVKVWVVGVDKDRRRVSLTMIKPGSESKRDEKEAGVKRSRRSGSRASDGKNQDHGHGKTNSRQITGRDGAKSQGNRGGEARRSGGAQRSTRGLRPGRGARHDRGHREQYRHKDKPKPFVPITEEMKSGKEAMRTFGDLAQYFNLDVPGAKPTKHGQGAKKKKNRKLPSKTDKDKTISAATENQEDKQPLDAQSTGDQQQSAPTDVNTVQQTAPQAKESTDNHKEQSPADVQKSEPQQTPPNNDNS